MYQGYTVYCKKSWQVKVESCSKKDLQNKEMIGDIWYPKASTMTLKYIFLADDFKHKGGLHQSYFIWSFLQANLNNRNVVKLDSIYGLYFP